MQSAIKGSVADNIRLLKALDQYAPELLVQIQEPQKIQIEIVESDNYGGEFDPTDEEKIWVKDQLRARRKEQRMATQKLTDAEMTWTQPEPLDT